MDKGTIQDPGKVYKGGSADAGTDDGGIHTTEAGGGAGDAVEQKEEGVYELMLLCWECGAEPVIECAMCGRARYCGVECQQAHWERHRDACRSLRPRDRVEGPNPPRADWENVAYQYLAGNKEYIDLVDQVLVS